MNATAAGHGASSADDDLDASVRQNVALIKAEPSTPVKDYIRGLVSDVKTAELREVG